METYSHQNVPVSQAVAKTPPNSAPRCHAWDAVKSRANTASDAICSHHSGCPLPGQASDAAWARPAPAAPHSAGHSAGGRDGARAKAPTLMPQRQPDRAAAVPP